MTAKKRPPSRKPAVARAATIGLSESSGWTLRRSSADIRKDPFAAALADTGKLSILDSAVLAVDPARRMTGAEPHASLDIQIHRRAGDAYVLMVRHQSGAIDFRLPEDGDTRRGRNGGGGTLRFSVPLPAEGSGGRRGPVTKVIKTYLLKVTGVLADKMMPTLGRAWEQNRWKRAGRAEGLKEFAALTASGKELQPVARKSRISTDPAKPNLLLIHGTFSDGLGGFSDLVETLGSDGRTFMEAAASIYGDRTFVFDHFTVSKTPEENARALLAELPDGATFDVITHSRGALVLRALASPGIPDALKRRIRIRRAVLVAGPNQGTPLASPDRFDRLLTWLSNLMDLFPANPFTEGVSFIAEGLAWVAHRVVGALPGLSAMDPKRLASSGAMLPRDVEISAIASNFEAPASLLQRFADVGVDFFFNQANDLVVPTEGGWRFGPLADDAVPGPRIGCFGRGGNMAGEALSHISFFSRPATVDFLCRALRGESHALAILEPGTDLPYLTRRGAGALLEGSMTSPPLATPPSPPPATAIDLARPQHKPQDESTDEIFYLSILSTDANATQKEPVQQEDQKKAGSGKKKKEPPLLLVATFRNAQAIEPFHISGGDAGRRFYEIITAQREIEAYINGERADSVLPHAHALIALGCTLFETLLPGNVRRLYDVARAEQKNRRVNIMFTSQIGWIANLPWEFIYDPARKTFLAASEINFTRNVITGVPGDRFPELSTQLRILVVVAQPLGLAYLGHDQEREVILTGFKRLIDANLARVTVLLDATPDMLHQELETSQHDILHFIGHGEYNQRTDTACLVFENQTGGIQKIEASVLQQIVCRRNIRLVFLNACETGKGGLADFNRGIAPALVEAGVPAVIGNQYSVLDVSATAFARHLYWMLAKGRTIGDATREARVAVNYLITGEAIDWAVPVLFARDPAATLCARDDSAAALVKTPAARTAQIKRERRQAARGRTRVALWDVQRTLPQLEAIAEKLTDCQNVYAFEPVYIIAPLGTWRRVPHKKKAYLNAENVAERLRGKREELGVDYLVAFTNLPMRDNKYTDLYAAVSDLDDKVTLFSTYEYLDYMAGERAIERMIANALVFSLTDVPSHNARRTARKDCPSYFNNEHDVRWVTGHLKFCPQCIKEGIDKKSRVALTSIMDAFW